jgi:uncharacterized phage-like protein YoqJ
MKEVEVKKLLEIKESKLKIVAATGHRPQSIQASWSEYPELLKEMTAVAYATLKKLNPDKVITGMALGWDTAIAIAAVKLKIPFEAAVPFTEHANNWNKPSIKLKEHLLSKADLVTIVTESNNPTYFQICKMMEDRNKYMVDKSTILLALWDGKTKGGTTNCMTYAKKKGNIKIINCWEQLQKRIEK